MSFVVVRNRYKIYVNLYSDDWNRCKIEIIYLFSIRIHSIMYSKGRKNVFLVHLLSIYKREREKTFIYIYTLFIQIFKEYYCITFTLSIKAIS